jgi:uncharacterized protein (UPF0332 family)
MFHAVRALSAMDTFDSKKHSGVIAYFNQNYVKNGMIEPRYSKMLTGAFKIRNDCDYDDFYIASHKDALIQYENAVSFLKRIEQCIEEQESQY